MWAAVMPLSPTRFIFTPWATCSRTCHRKAEGSASQHQHQQQICVNTCRMSPLATARRSGVAALMSLVDLLFITAERKG